MAHQSHQNGDRELTHPTVSCIANHPEGTKEGPQDEPHRIELQTLGFKKKKHIRPGGKNKFKKKKHNRTLEGFGLDQTLTKMTLPSDMALCRSFGKWAGCLGQTKSGDHSPRLSKPWAKSRHCIANWMGRIKPWRF